MLARMECELRTDGADVRLHRLPVLRRVQKPGGRPNVSKFGVGLGEGVLVIVGVGVGGDLPTPSPQG